MKDSAPNPTTGDAEEGIRGRGRVRAVLRLLPAGALLLTAAAGCYRKSDMAVQPKFWKVYRPTSFFADGQSARQLPEGVVPREELRTDREFYFGKDRAGKLIDHFPRYAYDAEGRRRDFPTGGADLARLIDRGRQRFNIYCIACHGQLGYGDGMIVQRGFPPPPSYHGEKLLRHEPVGHFYDVVTNGYGAMYSFAERVSPADRWAVVAYVKALQLSQNPSPQDVDKARALAPPEAQAPTAEPSASTGEGGGK